MLRIRAYQVLVGALGFCFVVFGLALVMTFFGYQRPGSTPGLPTGPVGYYFVAFTGCALVGWGGGLLGAARNPIAGRTAGTATALALVLMAVVRMVAWVVGDYSAWLGELPRIESGVFLAIALVLVWLRPDRRARSAPGLATGAASAVSSTSSISEAEQT